MNFHQVTATSVNNIIQASTSFLAIWYFKLLLRARICTQNIWFLNSCIRLNVFPRYIYLKTNNNTKSASKGQQYGMKKWLREDVKIQYNKRDIYNIYLKTIHSELAHRLTNIEFDIHDSHTRQKIEPIIHNKFIKQKKKLNILLKSRKNGTKTRNTQFSDHQFYKRFINLTETTFSPEETNLLEKGFSYNLKPRDDRRSREYLGVECELALDNLNITEKHILAKQIKTQPPEQRRDQSSSEYNTARTISRKTESEDIILTRADKGKSIVAVTKEQYISKTINFLNINKFNILKFDPTEHFQKLTKNVIKDLSLFNDFEKRNLILMNPQAPKLYSLIKLHKNNLPIRPVVSFVTAPSVKLSNKLIDIIQKYCNFQAQHSILNSYELINKIQHLQIPKNAKLISFDVQNLFPSIPPNEVISLVEGLLIKNRINIIIKQEILDCLLVCLDQNYFEFNNIFYMAKEGLIMGNPLSPLLAEIFMDHLESIILKHPISKYFLYWHRYVDDILVCFSGTDRQLQQFLNHINTIHSNIKFTIEIEQEKTINFLDLTIKNINNKHNFSIFHKPSHTDSVIHNNSNHPYSHKMAAFNSFIHRLLHVPMSEENYSKEMNIIKQIAVNNGYQPDIVDRMINKKTYQLAISKIYPNPKKNKESYKTITYTGQITQFISKELTKIGLNIAFRTNNKLSNIIKNNKNKSNKKTKSGIYKLNCGSCPKFYIGQTGRSFQKRINEHKRSYTKQNITSHYAEHLISTNHVFDDNFKILHYDRKSKKLNYLESLEINKYKNSNLLLNQQIETNNSPLLNLYPE